MATALSYFATDSILYHRLHLTMIYEDGLVLPTRVKNRPYVRITRCIWMLYMLANVDMQVMISVWYSIITTRLSVPATSSTA